MDLHCHVDLYPDPHVIIQKCKEQGTFVLSVTTTPSAFSTTKLIAENVPNIKTALGLHPQLAHERHVELDLFDSLVDRTDFIGEVGLDYSRGFKQFSEIQNDVFTHIVKKCSEYGGKYMSIHSRSSATAVMDTLEKFSRNNTHVFHWFSGTLKELQRAISMDSWFSVNIKMFSSIKGNLLLQEIPKDRLLLETDGPFIKSRGHILLPFDHDYLINRICDLWEIPINETMLLLNNNLNNVLNSKRK